MNNCNIQKLSYFVLSLFQCILDKNGIFEYRKDDNKNDPDYLGTLCYRKSKDDIPLITAERYHNPSYWEVFFADSFGYGNGSCVVREDDEITGFYFKYLEAFKKRLERQNPIKKVN